MTFCHERPLWGQSRQGFCPPPPILPSRPHSLLPSQTLVWELPPPRHFSLVWPRSSSSMALCHPHQPLHRSPILPSTKADGLDDIFSVLTSFWKWSEGCPKKTVDCSENFNTGKKGYRSLIGVLKSNCIIITSSSDPRRKAQQAD